MPRASRHQQREELTNSEGHGSHKPKGLQTKWDSGNVPLDSLLPDSGTCVSTDPGGLIGGGAGVGIGYRGKSASLTSLKTSSDSLS